MAEVNTLTCHEPMLQTTLPQIPKRETNKQTLKIINPSLSYSVMKLYWHEQLGGPLDGLPNSQIKVHSSKVQCCQQRLFRANYSGEEQINRLELGPSSVN